MPVLLKKFIANSLALSFVMSSAGPACFAVSAAPDLKEQTPKADFQKIAARPRVAVPPKTFKLNAGVTQEYVLGPGDVMSITDLSSDDDKPASTVMAPVLPDGTAVINYCGVIEAAGLSLREINGLVNEKAKKWFVNPEIVVNLARQRSTQVYMLGEVTHPGLYSPDATDRSSTDASSDMGGGGGGEDKSTKVEGQKSIFTVSTALELAGGLKDTADIRHIHVTRLHPRQVIDVDLWKLMLDGDVTEDLVLQPGDVVYVPKGGAEFNSADFGKVVSNSNKVRVLGAVKSPGLFVMSGDDDILSVLAKAGGFADTAKDGFVLLARTNRDGSVQTEKVDIKHAMKNPEARARAKVRPGDVIMVKTSMTKQVTSATGRILPQMLMQAGMMMMLRGATTTSTGK